MHACEVCGAVISGRLDRQTCSTRCRVRRHRAARRPDWLLSAAILEADFSGWAEPPPRRVVVRERDWLVELDPADLTVEIGIDDIGLDDTRSA